MAKSKPLPKPAPFKPLPKPVAKKPIFASNCTRQENDINNLRNQINQRNNEIRTWNSRFDDTNTRLNYYTKLYGDTNEQLNRVRTDLNAANIIVAKYNLFLPQYIDMSGQYNIMTGLYQGNLTRNKLTAMALNASENALDINIDLLKDKSKRLQAKESIIENFGDLTTFQQVQNENKKLAEQIRISSDIYSTDHQKVNFQSQNLEYVLNINFYLFWFYYFLIFVLTIVFLFVKTDVSRLYRVGIVLAFGAYPLVIETLEKMIYFFIMYTYSLMMGNVYLRNY